MLIVPAACSAPARVGLDVRGHGGPLGRYRALSPTRRRRTVTSPALSQRSVVRDVTALRPRAGTLPPGSFLPGRSRQSRRAGTFSAAPFGRPSGTDIALESTAATATTCSGPGAALTSLQRSRTSPQLRRSSCPLSSSTARSSCGPTATWTSQPCSAGSPACAQWPGSPPRSRARPRPIRQGQGEAASDWRAAPAGGGFMSHAHQGRTRRQTRAGQIHCSMPELRRIGTGIRTPL